VATDLAPRSSPLNNDERYRVAADKLRVGSETMRRYWSKEEVATPT
jgi:hypothetical protein